MQQTQKGDSWGQQPLLTTCGATLRSALSSALSGPHSPAGKEKHLIALSSAHPCFGQSFPRGKSSSRGLAKQPTSVPGEPCQPRGSRQMTHSGGVAIEGKYSDHWSQAVLGPEGSVAPPGLWPEQEPSRSWDLSAGKSANNCVGSWQGALLWAEFCLPEILKLNLHLQNPKVTLSGN